MGSLFLRVQFHLMVRKREPSMWPEEEMKKKKKRELMWQDFKWVSLYLCIYQNVMWLITWKCENTPNLFSILITLIHFFEFRVMRTRLKVLAKQQFSCGSYVFWIMGDENFSPNWNTLIIFLFKMCKKRTKFYRNNDWLIFECIHSQMGM